MAGEEKPCCSAEALRRIRQIDIDGHKIGLAMLDAVLAGKPSLKLLEGTEFVGSGTETA